MAKQIFIEIQVTETTQVFKIFLHERLIVVGLLTLHHRPWGLFVKAPEVVCGTCPRTSLPAVHCL